MPNIDEKIELEMHTTSDGNIVAEIYTNGEGIYSEATMLAVAFYRMVHAQDAELLTLLRKEVNANMDTVQLREH